MMARMDASSADVVRFGQASLAIVLGDITAIAADAIGNAANSSLSGGGGVDGAIHAAGGPAIMAELRRRFPGGTPTGTAVATTAGSLPARWVIHAVGPVWGGGRSGEAELLAAAYRSAVRLADDLGATLVDPAGDQRRHLRLSPRGSGPHRHRHDAWPRSGPRPRCARSPSSSAR